MKILVYGAGVQGSVYAARLQEVGHTVALLARGRRLAELREHGVTLEETTTGRRTTTRVELVERLAPDDAFDLIVVPMRKHQVAAVLPILASNRHTPSILFLHNNAGGFGELTAALGRERVLVGFPGASGTLRDGVVHYHLLPGWQQPTTLGEIDGRETPRLASIVGALTDAGFPVATSTTMDAWLKTHVAWFNPIANAFYMAGEDLGRLTRTRDALVLLVRAVREGLRVLRARDIPVTPPVFNVFDRLPEPLLVAALRRLLGSHEATTNLAPHLAAVRDEMRHLGGEFQVLARAAALPTPALDRLYAHSDTAVAPVAAGSAELPLEWRGLAVGLGTAVGLTLGLGALRGRRRRRSHGRKRDRSIMRNLPSIRNVFMGEKRKFGCGKERDDDRRGARRHDRR